MSIAQRIVEKNRAVTAQQSAPSSLTTFPSTLPNKFMRLTFFKYNRPGTAGSSSTENIEATINLPLPVNLIDHYVARFTGVDLGILGGLALDSGSAINEVFSNVSGATIGDQASSLVSSLKDKFTGAGVSQAVASDIASLLLIRFSGLGASALGLGGGLQTAAEQILGRIANPRTVSAFHGMNLRNHNFQWMLAPRNSAESEALENIFSTIRFHMHPDIGGTEYVLLYPSEVQIDIIGVEQNTFFFKRSVIVSFSVDRTGAGQPAFFKDTNLPVMYRCNLGMMEVETVTRRDLDTTEGGA